MCKKMSKRTVQNGWFAWAVSSTLESSVCRFGRRTNSLAWVFLVIFYHLLSTCTLIAVKNVAYNIAFDISRISLFICWIWVWLVAFDFAVAGYTATQMPRDAVFASFLLLELLMHRRQAAQPRAYVDSYLLKMYNNRSKGGKWKKWGNTAEEWKKRSQTNRKGDAFKLNG